MKRIGIMGCGVVGQYGHIPSVIETPGLSLAAVYDPNPAQFDRLRERHPEVPLFTDIEAFFASGIDAVSVTSPAPCHLDNVRLAARYGKHVLCEKPLAMDDSDICEMIGIAEDAGILLVTALCYRFSPVAMKIKELVAQGAIGKVRSIRLIYLWDLHGKYETGWAGEKIISPRRVGRMVEGGTMVDCGVHQIDLARWWTGSEVVEHSASAAWIDEEWEAPDHMWLHMEHANTVHTTVEISYSYTHTAKDPISKFSYELIGTDGLIRYDRDHWHFELRTPQGTYFFPGADEKNFHGMYAAWRDALETGRIGDLPSARDGLIVTRIARSATDGVIADHERRQRGGKL